MEKRIGLLLLFAGMACSGMAEDYGYARFCSVSLQQESVVDADFPVSPEKYKAPVEQDAKHVELIDKTPDLFEDVDAVRHQGLACWFDYNHDEWLDLAADRRVWVNHGGTNFTNIKGVGNVVAADFDNDGLTDLYSYSSRRLFRNNQGSLVEEVALKAEEAASGFPDAVI